MVGLQRLYSGDFNAMNVEVLPDGSQKITLSKDGDSKIYRFRVKNLYTEDEVVLEYEEVEVKPPAK